MSKSVCAPNITLSRGLPLRMRGRITFGSGSLGTVEVKISSTMSLAVGFGFFGAVETVWSVGLGPEPTLRKFLFREDNGGAAQNDLECDLRGEKL